MTQLSVDSHAHIFMKDGLGCIFQGDINEPLKATSWKNRFSSKTNAISIEKSGIGLLVVALYAHPLMAKRSIRKQVDSVDHFIATHNDWILAKSPAEARQGYRKGKKTMILSLEGAAEIIKTEDDIREVIDLGIRIVTPLHLGDDRLGGVAFLGGWKNLVLNPIASIKSLIWPEYNDGIKINSRGLSIEGVNLIKLLLKNHIWIDLSHSSHKSYEMASKIILMSGQPIFFSHSLPRKFRNVEAGISDGQLADVRRSHGIIGLSPVKDFLDLSSKEYRDSNDPFEKFCLAYKEVSDKIGVEGTVFGTDFNGGVSHLPPPVRQTRTPIDVHGLWNIGQEKDLWKALENRNIKIPSPRSKSIEYFIEAWERVFTYPDRT